MKQIPDHNQIPPTIEGETICHIPLSEREDNPIIPALLSLWEESVRATHHFLGEEDIIQLRPAVIEAIKGINDLYVAYKSCEPVAFIGIDQTKIEMLFVSPSCFKKGIGRRLVDLAVKYHQATLVDVNEQNPNVRMFYEHLGFKNYARMATDGQGNPFPILHMKLKETLFETERLLTRPLQVQDTSLLYAFMHKEEVMYAWEHGFTEPEVREWINRQIYRYYTDGVGYWGVTLRENRHILIGQTGLMKCTIQGKEVTELGYIFDNGYWHKGYAYEAARGVLQYAFNDLELNEVYCTIRPMNKSSVRLAERLNMTLCGDYSKNYLGKEMVHLIYKLTKEQFTINKRQ